ncbi:MAG: hypothetical protein LBI10_11430 [Deltaproteobacteria bacterium]|jgi:hypothetical protein|nr:hypothetical protein [Deltaproteobacteria bacterium]
MAEDNPVFGLATQTADLVDQVRGGLQGFIATIKNCALYPDNNQIRQESLTKTYQWLANFLEEHESLKLFVDLNSLIFLGQIVHQDRQSEQNIVFPLFRDGVQWVEFLEGLTLDETLAFINLLNRFRLVKEEDEDDLVTAMWEADFLNIKYKTANEFWDIDPLTEIAALKVVNAPGPNAKDALGGGGNGGETKNPEGGPATLQALFHWLDEKTGTKGQFLDPNHQKQPSSASTSSGPALPKEILEPSLWRLTEAEKIALEELIAKNARRSVQDGLEAALSILKSAKTPASQAPILDFLAETSRFALAWGELNSPLSIVNSLQKLASTHPETLGQILLEFQTLLGREEILDGLTIYSPPGGEISPNDLARLKTFLTFLPPKIEVAEILIKLYPKVQCFAAKNEILKAIINLARLIGGDLASTVNHNFPPATVIHLIDLVALTENDQSIPFVVGLSKNITPAVREKAAQILLENNPARISILNHLLADPDPLVNRLVFSLISRKRDPAVEKTILNFLKNSYDLNQPRSEEVLLNSYRCLGLCASSLRAAEFAERVLLKKDLKALFGLGVDIKHREGAALALLLMPPGLGQERPLTQAAHSFFRDLRRAYQVAETLASSKAY